MNTAGRSSLLPPFHFMTTYAWRPDGALGDGKQGAHADLAKILLAEHFHIDAELLQFLGFGGEFLRTKRVGGFVTRSRAITTPSATASVSARPS